MNALSHQKHADIHLWQKDNFFTIKELVRDSKWTIFQHESTTDSTGSEIAYPNGYRKSTSIRHFEQCNQ